MSEVRRLAFDKKDSERKVWYSKLNLHGPFSPPPLSYYHQSFTVGQADVCLVMLEEIRYSF